MNTYVAGFAHDGERVALIRKKRPEWQAGLLNGIGGHIEPGEDSLDAMVREFREETGYPVTWWRHLLRMRFPGAWIDFYVARVATWELGALGTTTDEEIFVRDASSLRSDEVIPNLSWLIPMAMYEEDLYEPFDLYAKSRT